MRNRLNPFRRKNQIEEQPEPLQGEEYTRLPPGSDGSSGSLRLHSSDPEVILSDNRFVPRGRSESSPTSSLLLQSALAIFHKWGKVFASGAQIACIAYLAHALWSAAAEVVEEYKGEIYGGDFSVFSRENVLDAIQFLEQPNNEAKVQLDCAQWENDSAGLPLMPTLQMVQRLALAGVPLRSQNRTGTSKPSVESLLLSLSRTEHSILQQCLWVPSTQHQKRESVWNDIIGLDRVKRSLLATTRSISESKSLPAYGSLFEHSSPFTGVLLYGFPGCGKSFLIKGVSSEASIPCLVISPSVLLRKYVGETNQQCRSLFSLAQKLAPCILCIDEVDGLFRERNEWEHEVSRDLKTEFLQYLDGMMGNALTDTRGNKRRNLVIAATNRPFDVDPAILRRLTQSYFIDLPDFSTRSAILRHMLRSVPTDPKIDIPLMSSKTEGYSPSDLRQLLQAAVAAGPLQESATNPPPLTTQHVLDAMKSVSPAPLSANFCPVTEPRTNFFCSPSQRVFRFH
ncbi:hypothetical protein ACA910_011304 [Epithemia clementina (nom. ined.)]